MVKAWISCSLACAALALASPSAARAQAATSRAFAGSAALQPAPPTSEPVPSPPAEPAPPMTDITPPAAAPSVTPAPAIAPPGSQPVLAPSRSLGFESHAKFYSDLVGRTPIIDPQIFVKDDAAAGATGPQGIEHGKGFRPARPDEAPDTNVYDADGRQLPFTLGTWFGANGSVTIEPDSGPGDAVLASFDHLIASGVYSLFKGSFAPDGAATFAPLDGQGESNGFTAGADGTAHLTVETPSHLAPGDAIVLVYHSDGLDHGAKRGELGLTAHEELIVRLPK